MKQVNPSPSKEYLTEIRNIFHPLSNGSFFIKHNCFLVDNHFVQINQMYLLFDYSGDSISNITVFRLIDVLIVYDFILITGIDLLTNQEEGRNEYVNNNECCSFKLLDFPYLKTIINKEKLMLNKKSWIDYFNKKKKIF